MGTAWAQRGGACVAGAVVIGTVIGPETLRLGEFSSAFLAHFPKLQARLQHGISGGVCERVKTAELDARFFLGPVVDSSSRQTDKHAQVPNLPQSTLQCLVIGPPEWQTDVPITACRNALAEVWDEVWNEMWNEVWNEL